jgi:hypothetical protein
MGDHFLLTLFLQLKTFIQQEIPLCEVTMQDGLSVKIPVSETTDISKRKTETIYVTEKLTTLRMKTISVIYDICILFMKRMKE